MAKSKEDVKYATAQSKLSEDEALRVRYKAGTPLEGGKISDSEPVDLFAGATNISKAAYESDRTISESEPVDVFASARKVSTQLRMMNTPAPAEDMQNKLRTCSRTKQLPL